MKIPPIVDARSGQRVLPGQWVRYPPAVDGTTGLPMPETAGEDDWQLVDIISVGWFEAKLAIARPLTHFSDGRLVMRTVLCPVRWFHPAATENGAWRVILVTT